MTDSQPLSPFGGLNPGALFLAGEDNLRITSFGALAGVTLAIEGRLVACDGTPIAFAEPHAPSSTRVAATSLITLAAGWLANLQVRVTAGAVKRGHVFVLVEIVRGRLGGLQSLGVLLSGYVAASVPIAWPGGAVASSLDGAGNLRSIVGTNPAAGVEISETVPTGARWKLRHFSFTLVASAAAANRVPVLTIDDGANILWESGSNVAQTAAQTAKYRAGVGVPFFTYDTRAYHLPLPGELWLNAGARIRTVTAAIDVGDDYAAPIYSVEEWLEP